MASIQSILRRRTLERTYTKLGVPVPADPSAHHDAHGLGHVMPIPLLVAVLGALLFLTFVTVAVTWFDLGAFNIWLALLVAAVKASLVCLYFMHLRYDNPFNGIALVASFFFVSLFIALAISDSGQYNPLIQPNPTRLEAGPVQKGGANTTPAAAPAAAAH
jgi:cytochrome c oxidase subunit IV